MNPKIKLNIKQSAVNVVELEYDSIIEACNAVEHIYNACTKNTEFSITRCEEENE